MANKGDEAFKQDVEKAVNAGSDLSQGGEHAYKSLMAELAKDQEKYKADPAKFDQLGKAVVDKLQANNVLDDHMLRWSRDNMGRFDTSGDKKVDRYEMDPRNPTAVNGFERAMMERLQSTYASLQRSSEIQPLIGKNDDDDPFSQKDFKKLIAAREKPLTEERENNQQSELAARKQAQQESVTAALLSNKGGDRDTSLAAVLDTQKGRNPDGEISRGDIKKFIENYPQGSKRGDFGFTPENLKAAQLLNSQWNDDLGKSLRGQYERNNGNGHGGSPDMVTYDRIDLKRLAEMRGQTEDQMFAQYAGDGKNQQQLAGRPLKGDAMKAVSANGEEESAEEAPLTGKRPTLNADDSSAVAPLDEKAVNDQTKLKGKVTEAAPTEHEEVFAGKRNGEKTVRPIKDDAATEGDKNKKAAPAKFEAPPPIPDLVMPEVKAGEDVTKVREEFAKKVEEHFKARSEYTVRPGQGWDRIARDVLRQEKDGSHTNERNVVGLSDHIARGNGWDGRLDPNKMLHPGDKVRVISDEGIKTRSEEMMKAFDNKVAEVNKAAELEKEAAAKKAADGNPSLFDGKRSGEGTVDAPVDTTKAAPVDTTTVAPADTTKVAPVDTTTVAPADTTKVAPVDTTTVAPVDTTKVAPADTTQKVAPVDTTTTTGDTSKLKASTEGITPDGDFAEVKAVSAADGKEPVLTEVQKAQIAAKKRADEIEAERQKTLAAAKTNDGQAQNVSANAMTGFKLP